jgi:hypothetical protein
MKLFAPFRDAPVPPPCECDWCKKSPWRRSMTWLARAGSRLLLLLGAIGVVAWVGVAISSYVHEDHVTERHSKDVEQERYDTCVDEAFVIEYGETGRSCRPGARVEAKPAGLGSRQVVLCRCPYVELPKE